MKEMKCFLPSSGGIARESRPLGRKERPELSGVFGGPSLHCTVSRASFHDGAPLGLCRVVFNAVIGTVDWSADATWNNLSIVPLKANETFSTLCVKKDKRVVYKISTSNHRSIAEKENTAQKGTYIAV